MPRNVLREEVQELQRQGTAIAEGLPAAERMRHGGYDSLLVTDNDGRLLGALYREDAERALSREPARAGNRR